jgi:signal transduction histidine kinase
MSYKRPATSYWLVGGLCAALIVLAALQYRWSGQVSEAERARMRTNLQIAVSQYRQDFSRDLLNLCSGFQADAATMEKRDWDQLARQGSEWLRTSAEAGLVSGVYLWQAEPDSLLRLNRASQHFEEAAVQAAPEALLAQFRAQAGENPQARPFRMMTWTLEAHPPALVHPLYDFPEPGERTRPTLAGFVAIEINPQYLQQKFLPELAARHFSGPDGFLYNVGILAADDPAHPFYRSDGFNTANIATADINVAMFDPRPRAPGVGPGGPNPGGPGPGGRRRENAPGPGQRGRRPPAGPPGPPDEASQRDRYRFVSRFAATQPLALVPDPRNQWRLVARHRAGSVDVAVAQTRWRDLAVSFVILMLLGASMALIVVSTQRAQRLARLQMEFVAGISHELRTPLTVISSAAQNLTDGIVEGKQQVKLYGTLIRTESRRLTGMMEQILQFAAGQKKRDYEPVPLAPAELIENALALGASLIQEAGVTVEREIPASLPNIMGEPGALMQCLHNLIANAVKYGGEARWLRIRAWADEDSVRIAVEDRGMGIESAELPHIFDAFYRSRAVSSAQIHGTGLGLNLARNFAREAGGSIAVESTPGQGSTFIVRLPAVRAAAATEAVNLAERTV